MIAGSRILVVFGAVAVANAAMAVINPFSPQSALSTMPKPVSTVSTAPKLVSTAVVSSRVMSAPTTIVVTQLSAPTIIVPVRSGFTPPTGTPKSIALLPPPPVAPAR